MNIFFCRNRFVSIIVPEARISSFVAQVSIQHFSAVNLCKDRSSARRLQYVLKVEENT